MSAAQRAAIDAVKGRVMEHLERAVPSDTFNRMMVACGLDPRGRIGGLPHARILDRALQELRRAGQIRFVDRRWQFVRGGS